jgi:hypothetical protein
MQVSKHIMTTRRIIILIFTFFISLCHGQMRERFYMNDLKRQKLNGKVKDVKFIEYEARYNKEDSTYTLKIFDFLSMKNNISSFNKLGYLEKKTELSFDIKDSMSISAIWTYQYDKKNRIIREFRDSKKNGDTSSWNYKYMNNNTLIKYYQKDYHVLYYKYSQMNEVELLTTANSDSSYQRKMKFIYDKENRLIRYENYENTDSIVSQRVLSYTNESRNFNNEINEDKKYKYKINKSFEYDENGNVKKIFNEEQKLTGWFEYVYDRNKNWIEQKCYNSSGKIYNVYKREISYY